MSRRLLGLGVAIPCLDEPNSVVDKLINELRKEGAEVIVVDDGSLKPHKKSLKLGTNRGYGVALMTGIANLKSDVVATMDSDSQHTVSELIKLYKAWKLMQPIDMLVGMRRLDKELWYRYVGRKVLNLIASVLSTRFLNDLNSGMRIFKKQVAWGYRDILCGQFSFTTSLTLSMVCDGYRVEYFPINVRARVSGKSKVNLVKHGFITLWYIIWIGGAIRTRKIRSWMRKILNKKNPIR